MKIWNSLASIDCSNHIEKKGNLSYLSWAWAWKTLCDNFPDSTFEFEKSEGGSEFWAMPDGTGEVRCALTVGGLTRTCWLPVMDYKNKAIENPNSRDVNDAKMRCLVKAIALFGLGLYIYAGEDIPDKPSGDVQKKAQVTAKQDSFLAAPSGPCVPIGKWEGASFNELADKQKEALWEHRKNFEDYPDFMSALQAWRADS
tara:strand:- start:5279 stop:5878 length:600 start_codon:yes stop_codon:yes gene_type:complete